jgi:hypothetical protein
MMEKETKKNGNTKHALLRQTAGLFSDAYEWCLVDWVYWKSNTQKNRTWTCRMTPIQENTPIKRLETISATLERLSEKGLGFSKVPHGEPQLRRYGKDRAKAEMRQSYEYAFDANVFDEWLEKEMERLSESGKATYPKADSTYPNSERGLSESGKVTYPKTDTTIMTDNNEEKKEKKKDLQQGDSALTFLSQAPSRTLAPNPFVSDEERKSFSGELYRPSEKELEGWDKEMRESFRKK